MVGHSLGAHLCGYAGDYLKRRWRLTVGRITGLDPAEPHFEWAHPVTRLDEGDAYFVDVIHTDSNPMLSFGLGMHQVGGESTVYSVNTPRKRKRSMISVQSFVYFRKI